MIKEKQVLSCVSEVRYLPFWGGVKHVRTFLKKGREVYESKKKEKPG